MSLFIFAKHNSLSSLIQEWREAGEEWTTDLHQDGQYWSYRRTVSRDITPPALQNNCVFSVIFHSHVWLYFLRHPSLEEVLSWSRSFELMLRSLEGREVFREFLRSEYSEDNLLFWLACEDLKKETNATVVDEKARIIYEDYVSILSPKEVHTVFQWGCVFEEGFIYTVAGKIWQHGSSLGRGGQG